MENYETQKLFFNYLIENDLLYDFLQRAKNGILAKDIMNDIKQHNINEFNNIEIISKIKESPLQDDIYVLIELKINNQIVGHVTFHMLYDKKRNLPPSALHITNDRIKRKQLRLRVEKLKPHIKYGIRFTKGSCVVSKCDIDPPLPTLLSSLINVLNVYCLPHQQEKKPLTKIPIHERIDTNINYFINRIKEFRPIRGGTRKKQKMIFNRQRKTKKHGDNRRKNIKNNI